MHEEQVLGSRRMWSDKVLQTVFNCAVHHCVVQVAQCGIGHQELLEYMINTVLCQNTCELICLKLCTMLAMTKLYSLSQVWMTLMFMQGHRVTGKLQIVASSCCKVVWHSSKVHDGWLCKSDDHVGVLYGDYGSFEHLFRLFVVITELTWHFLSLVQNQTFYEHS